MATLRDPISVPPLEQPAREADLLRSGSILIYCRASMTLSLLVYAALAAMLYSDLYVHLIRQTARTLIGSGGLPGFFLALLAASCIWLAGRIRPRLERVALLLLAVNLAALFLRRRVEAPSGAYVGLCVLSFLLDLGILAAVIGFYRKYPNVLKILRSRMSP
jgi:hypothetical protein